MVKDELSLAVSNSTTSKNTFTKKEVLSKIASMWDPLGICAGYLTKGRLIFQSIVRLKLRWDDDIGDTDLYQKWTAWVEQMSSCEDMIIGRSIVPTKPIKNYPDCQLVGFCDGSATAYGCALYLRWASKDESETEVMFLGSKGKVGSISGNTVPRQELCGALLLSRMTNSVENALAHTELKDLLSTDTKLFCDSTTVIRWVNVQAESADERGKVAPPRFEEIQRAEHMWIRKEQEQLKNLPANVTEKLVPFKDKDGICRVYGRLKNSPIFNDNVIHPILLHGKNPVTELIVREIHDGVMAECRKKFWIIGIRQLAKSMGARCVTCRWRGARLEQFMADLADFRITPGSPFENSSIDYFGPFELRFGRRQRSKGYGAIITCLTTRAIHIELVTDLTVDRLLMALRRFISLYGQPKFIRSDNGSNFRGAASELRRMFARWRNGNERNTLNDLCASYSIKWTFSTPTASHHNGAVEALIKSVKNSLNKVVTNKVLTEEEYRTVLSEVTACVNSRPLWPPSDGDLQQPPLTCNDLLRPAGLDRNPETLNLVCNPRRRYAFIQVVVEEWWKQWAMYFVPNLLVRNKWFKKRENLAQGDVVLMMDVSASRGKWKLGIVEQVFPGRDELVRSAEVRSSVGTYKRPITKLTLLLSKEEIDETIIAEK